MSIVSRCHGRVALGELPDDVRARLASIPGEWLEYDPESGAVLVRYVQPTEAPVLAATASELVRILDEIPYDLQTRIPGGDLFVRTEESEQLIRLRVTAGGALHIRWAHPGYDGALQRPYSDGHEIAIESFEQRLNGSIELGADDPQAAASELQDLADTFEGLYPEGDFRAEADASDGTVRVALSEVNLDAVLLIERMQALAEPRSLRGWLDVSSFEDAAPEHLARVLFKKGEVWVQHPLLWSDPPEA
ncbi:MAG: hypothetical protein P8Y10_02365 [Gemmatimonadales bacterium]|jgi:hypothetical protein